MATLKAERRPRVKQRNRYDVKFFFPDSAGASLRWTSNPQGALTADEMVDGLTEIIAVLRQQPPSPTKTVVKV